MHEGRPMGYPYVRAMGCRLWGSYRDIHELEFELTGDATCIDFAGGPWGICCEDPVVMWYINHNSKSQGKPHLLSSRTIRGRSAVRILQKMKIHLSEFELTGDGPCVALADEPLGVCCEDPVVMWYINQNLNSQGHPMYRPYRRAMGYLLWGSSSDAIH